MGKCGAVSAAHEVDSARQADVWHASSTSQGVSLVLVLVGMGRCHPSCFRAIVGLFSQSGRAKWPLSGHVLMFSCGLFAGDGKDLQRLRPAEHTLTFSSFAQLSAVRRPGRCVMDPTTPGWHM